jgi:hypothetical protein
VNDAAGARRSRPKVVITGTGRAGTTLLVQVLTDLGLDTGFTADAKADPQSRGGLEKSITDPSAPWIVKSPSLSTELGRLLDEQQVVVEHVIVPIRDLDVAAASRVRTTSYGTNLRTTGGLLGTPRATRQRAALAAAEYELFYTIARFDLPHTLLYFPRFAQDWEYTHRRLSFLAPELPPERWKAAVEQRYQPTMLHEEPLSARERAMAFAGTMYQRGIASPTRAARRVIRGESARSSPKTP